MKLRTLTLLLGIVISPLWSVAATIYDLPGPITSNSQGPWSVEYATGPVWNQKTQLSLMEAGTGTYEGYWKNPDASTPRVRKDSTDPVWIHSGHQGQNNDAGVLVFTAPETGYYSVDLMWKSYGLGGDLSTQYLKVKTASDANTDATVLWSTTHSWATGSSAIYSDDLSQVSALQDIYLTAGSFIFFDMYLHPQSYYPGAANRFYNSDDSGTGGSIAFTAVPEPCTAVLLFSSFGYLFVRNRRKQQ